MEDPESLARHLQAFINRSNRRFYVSVLAGLCLTFGIPALFFSLVRSGVRETIAQHEQQFIQLQTSLGRYAADVETAAGQAASLKQETISLSKAVRGLTTQEVVARLAVVEKRADAVSEQLSTLQGIITPDTAAQILSAARVREEVLARGDFEERVNTSVGAVSSRLAAVEGDLRNLYYWLLGGLGSILALTIAVIGFAGKQIASLLVQTPHTESKSN